VAHHVPVAQGDLEPSKLPVMTAEESAPRLQYIARLLGVPVHGLVTALEKQFPRVDDESPSKVDLATLSPNQMANLAADLDVKDDTMVKVLKAVAKRLRATQGTVLDRPQTKGSW
jgi:hypothetical protein